MNRLSIARTAAVMRSANRNGEIGPSGAAGPFGSDVVLPVAMLGHLGRVG